MGVTTYDQSGVRSPNLHNLPARNLSFAQDKPTGSLGTPGCGDPDAKFDVKTDREQHPVQPEPDKALVYLIQDDLAFALRPRPTTRMGIDGRWVGATPRNSYFYFSVDPGVHHLCASWQTTGDPMASRDTAAAHFTAEAKGVYYFGAKDVEPCGG